MASWSWEDGGAGGSFSPSASVQNPTYAAPVVAPGSELPVTLTISATCSGPDSLADSDSTTLTVVHTWIEDDDPAIAYSGEWSQYNHPAASAGHVTYSGETSATAEITFEGTGLRWHVAKGPMAGKAKVWLDGAGPFMADLYLPSLTAVTLQKTGLPLTTHTLKIEVSGEKNPSSTNYFVDIDAFEVVP